MKKYLLLATIPTLLIAGLCILLALGVPALAAFTAFVVAVAGLVESIDDD